MPNLGRQTIAASEYETGQDQAAPEAFLALPLAACQAGAVATVVLAEIRPAAQAHQEAVVAC